MAASANPASYSLVPSSIPRLAPEAGQTPASNTDAVKTLGAVTGKAWVIKQILFSYSATPAAGSAVTIVDGSNTETYYVSSAGPGPINFIGKEYPINTAVVVTLTAGGSGISGSVWPEAFTK